MYIMSTYDKIQSTIEYHKKELARLEAEANAERVPALVPGPALVPAPIQVGGGAEVVKNDAYKAQKYKYKFDNLVKDLKMNHNYTDERIAEIMKEGGFEYPIQGGGSFKTEIEIEPIVEMVENATPKSAVVLPFNKSYEYKNLKYKTKLANLRKQIKQQYGKTDAELDAILKMRMQNQQGGKPLVADPKPQVIKDEKYKTEKYKFKIEQLRKKLNAQGISNEEIDNVLKNN